MAVGAFEKVAFASAAEMAAMRAPDSDTAGSDIAGSAPPDRSKASLARKQPLRSVHRIRPSALGDSADVPKLCRCWLQGRSGRTLAR